MKLPLCNASSVRRVSPSVECHSRWRCMFFTLVVLSMIINKLYSMTFHLFDPWFPCPNVGQASTNLDHRLDPGACFLYLTNLHLSVI